MLFRSRHLAYLAAHHHGLRAHPAGRADRRVFPGSKEGSGQLALMICHPERAPACRGESKDPYSARPVEAALGHSPVEALSSRARAQQGRTTFAVDSASGLSS